MSSAPTLNTFTPGSWARVVSGVTWAEYGLTEDGQVSHAVTRGPVVLWPKTGGQGEDLRPAKEKRPTLTPLEGEALRLNMRPHFLAFVRAVHGKVRASVRWKTAPKTRRLRKIGELDRVSYLALLLKRRSEGKRGFYITGRSRRMTAKERREAEREARREHIQQRLEQLAPGVEEYIDEDGTIHYMGCVDDALLKATVHLANAIKKGCRTIKRLGIEINILSSDARARTLLGDALFYALTVGDLEVVAGIVANIQARRGNKRRASSYLLALIRAAFRAHVTRRVKPPTRRTRVPRPLYARPRPPTCPLAPPLA